MHLEMDITKMGLRLQANLEDMWWAIIEIYRDPEDKKNLPYLYDATVERWDHEPLVFTNLTTHTWPKPSTLAENIEHYLRDSQITCRWPGKHSVVSTEPIAWFFDVEIVPNGQADFATVSRVYTKPVTEIRIKFKDYIQTTYVDASDIQSLLQNIKGELGKRCSSWVEEEIRNAGFETNENDPYVLSALSARSIRQQG